jgi:hypothetical protein
MSFLSTSYGVLVDFGQAREEMTPNGLNLPLPARRNCTSATKASETFRSFQPAQEFRPREVLGTRNLGLCPLSFLRIYL